MAMTGKACSRRPAVEGMFASRISRPPGKVHEIRADGHHIESHNLFDFAFGT
jgi:hypothetical protein